MDPMISEKPYWTSPVQFTLVSAIALVGIANFWRLPWLVSQYGGMAFLLVYGAALLIMGLPMYTACILLSRGNGQSVPGIISHWTAFKSHAWLWHAMAWLFMVAALLLLASHAVVGSWGMAYGLRAFGGQLATMTMDQAQDRFVALATDGEAGLGWLLLFFLMWAAMAAHGLNRGVEPVMRTLALCVFVITLLTLIFLIDKGRASVLLPTLHMDWQALGIQGALEAVQQAFFSLGLGSGVVLALSTYLPLRANAIRLSARLLILPQLMGLLIAWLLIIATEGQVDDLGSGVQTLFTVLPVELQSSAFNALFYLLLILVCLTVGMGLFIPLVQVARHYFQLGRVRAAVQTGIVVALAALLAQNSIGALSDWQFHGLGIFDLYLLVGSRLVMPITALMACVLVGLVLEQRQLHRAWVGSRGLPIGLEATDIRRTTPVLSRSYRVWRWSLRYPTRILLIAVVGYNLGAYHLAQWLWNP